MFYTIYTSSDNDNFNIYKDTSHNAIENIQPLKPTPIEENLCIICWTKNNDDNSNDNNGNNDNTFVHLKDCNKYLVSCNCNVLIHSLCLDKWIIRTNSCPICRNKININSLFIEQQTNKSIRLISYYYICFQYFIYILRFASIASIINFLLMVTINTYYYLKSI